MRLSTIKIVSLWAIILSIGSTTQAASFGGGAGEPNDPYQIWTAAQMNAIGADPNLWDKHFVLMDDIDLSAYDGFDGRESFNLIGEVFPGVRGGPRYRSFKGVFDGNGHSIANISAMSPDESYWGLFRVVEDPNAEIKNLTLIHPILVADTGDSVGALVGQLSYSASISNCRVEDGIIIGGNHVGGLVGYSTSPITGCYASGIVIGNNYVGGLIGYCDDSITESHASGKVIGNNDVGGLVGYSYSQQQATISRCSAESTVQGFRYVGGLVGIGQVLRDCYAISVIFAEDYAGGLVGGSDYIGYIENCYAASTLFADGSPYGDDSIGGLVGHGLSVRGSSCSIVNSFYDLQVRGYWVPLSEEGRTTYQMQTIDMFLDTGWDFVGESDNGTEDIWWMPENDYPRLWWEVDPTP